MRHPAHGAGLFVPLGHPVKSVPAIHSAASIGERQHSSPMSLSCTTDTVAAASEALCVACTQGDLDRAQEYLDRGAEVDWPGEDGKTALFIACDKGHLGLVQLLLARGADVHREAQEFGCTPLSVARRHEAVFALLEEHMQLKNIEQAQKMSGLRDEVTRLKAKGQVKVVDVTGDVVVERMEEPVRPAPLPMTLETTDGTERRDRRVSELVRQLQRTKRVAKREELRENLQLEWIPKPRLDSDVANNELLVRTLRQLESKVRDIEPTMLPRANQHRGKNRVGGWSLTLGRIFNTQMSSLTKCDIGQCLIPDLRDVLRAIRTDLWYHSCVVNYKTRWLPHRDEHNDHSTRSLIVMCGVRKGGGLYIVEDGVVNLHNIYYKHSFFDGRNLHWTEPWDPADGDRITFVFYNPRSCKNIPKDEDKDRPPAESQRRPEPASPEAGLTPSPRWTCRSCGGEFDKQQKYASHLSRSRECRKGLGLRPLKKERPPTPVPEAPGESDEELARRANKQDGNDGKQKLAEVKRERPPRPVRAASLSEEEPLPTRRPKRERADEEDEDEAPRFNVGETVRARWHSQWYKGVVDAVIDDGYAYEIVWDGCNTMCEVRNFHVRALHDDEDEDDDDDYSPAGPVPAAAAAPPVVPAPASPRPLPYDPLPGGMTGEPSRKKKKPRLAPDGTHPSTLAYSLGPVAPYRLGSVVGVKCEEHDDAGSEERPLLVTFVKKPKADVDAEAEFEFVDASPDNAKVLAVLDDVAASQRGR